MNRTKATIVIYGVLITIVLLIVVLYIRYNTNESLPTNTISPPVTPQAVEYFLDRTAPTDQYPPVTPVVSLDATKAAAVVKTTILSKYEQNYPYNQYFPYISETITASYKLEPRTLYIETTFDDQTALNMLEIYLKKFNVKLIDLKQRGVTVRIDRAPKSTDSLMRD